MSTTIPSKISTPRLTLIRLTNTSPSHPHVQLFHENWSDPTATAWSLHGATKSLDESRDWMIEHRTKYDNIFYSVFAKPQQSESDNSPDQKIWSMHDVQLDLENQVEEEEEEDNEILGTHIGSVSLRLQPSGPVLSPFSALCQTNGANHQDQDQDQDQDLDLRVLGYAMLPSAWGRGYATEANRGMLDAYAASVPRDAGKKYYVEAAVDEDNAASEKVLKKLGFGKVGWKDEEEKVWLNGGWRGPGYWVYGMFV